MKPSTSPAARPPLDRQATVTLPPDVTAGIAALSANDARAARQEAAIREARILLLAAEAILGEALRG